MLFSDDKMVQDMSIESLNFYNKVKEIIIKSSDSEKTFNFKVFTTLLKELRIKLDVIKSELGPDKFSRDVNFGQEKKSSRKSAAIRKKRIEQLVFKDFNLINISRINEAINGE